MLLCLKINLQEGKFIFIMLKVILVLHFNYPSSVLKKKIIYFHNVYHYPCVHSFSYGIEFHELNRTKISPLVSWLSDLQCQMWIEPCAKVVFSFAENNKIGNGRCHVTGSHGEALYTDISSMVLI